MIKNCVPFLIKSLSLIYRTAIITVPMAIASCVSSHFSARNKIEQSLADAKIKLAIEQTAIIKQMRESPEFRIEYADRVINGLAGAAAVLSSTVPAQK
jgi:hypothetical protein